LLRARCGTMNAKCRCESQKSNYFEYQRINTTLDTTKLGQAMREAYET
jgi:hypothetical protein